MSFKVKDEKYGYSKFLLMLLSYPNGGGFTPKESFVGSSSMIFIGVILTWVFASMGKAFYYSIELINFWMILFCGFIFSKILTSLIDGKPFSLDNAHRMRTLGFSFLLIEAFNFILYKIGFQLFPEIIEVKYLVHKILLFTDLKGIVAGLIFLFMYEVFRTGHRLQQENDLTI